MGADHKPALHRASKAVLEATGEALQERTVDWTRSRAASWVFYIWDIKGVYAVGCLGQQVSGIGMVKRGEGLLLFVGRADGSHRDPKKKLGNLLQRCSVLLLERKSIISILTFFSARMYTISNMQQRNYAINLLCYSQGILTIYTNKNYHRIKKLLLYPQCFHFMQNPKHWHYGPHWCRQNYNNRENAVLFWIYKNAWRLEILFVFQ